MGNDEASARVRPQNNSIFVMPLCCCGEEIQNFSALRFSLVDAQGYVDYGRWPNRVLLALRFSLGVAQIGRAHV